jgi:hypothetical protein
LSSQRQVRNLREMTMSGSTHASSGAAAGYRRGQVVTVRSLDEILATLDADAKCDGLPFMPEMIPHCGKTFRVFRRAEKTCVEGIGMRTMRDAVFLEELRCDGSAHDGCQRGCLFFWKEAWLKPAGQAAMPSFAVASASPGPGGIRAPSQLPTRNGDGYFCQSTELLMATTDFPMSKLWYYWRDYRLGELRPRRFAFFIRLAISNRLSRLFRGRNAHQLTGDQQQTLNAELNLQPGELVEIKSPEEIKATLDAQGRNRGLSFEPEMALHCGRRYRVAAPLRTIIFEKTGKMIELANTVTLEGLVCEGICAANCPRANFFYWREVWLKRVEDGAGRPLCGRAQPPS